MTLRSGRITQYTAQVNPCCRSFYQQRGINRWFKQRQLPHYPFNVHAVPDLEQPVFHCIPILKYPIVVRDAEIENVQLGEGLGSFMGTNYLYGRIREILHQDFYSLVAERIQVAISNQFVIRIVLMLYIWNFDGTRSKQFICQHIQHRSLVD